MTDKEKLLEKTMKNTRAVLLPNREGLLSDAFEKEFRGFFGFPFPYERLGFVSAMELIEYMYHKDVVSVERLPSGHILLKGIPDKNTEHVSRMVKNQRRNEEGYNRRTAQIIRQQGPGFRRHIERSQVTEAAREVPKHTKAIVEDMMLEHEDGLAVADFCRAFHEKEGYRIEFMSWGFLNLEDFLYYGLGDTVELSPVDGHYGIEWILFPKQQTESISPKLDDETNPNLYANNGQSKEKFIESESVSDQMKAEFSAILKVHPEGITSNKFAGEYQKWCGKELVPKQFGYQTIVEMCLWLPDIFEIVRDGSVWRFKASQKEFKKELCVSELVPDQMKTKFSAVLGDQDGLTADKFAEEYQKLYGSKLVPQQFGCQTVLEMCLWLPDIFEIIRDGGVWRFKARQKEFKKEGERIVPSAQKVISADSVEKCSLMVAEHIKSNIKRVLMKHPHGLAYQKFRRAYLDTIGNNLQVKSLESFFKSPGIRDMVQLKQEAGKVVVMPSSEINNILSHMDKRFTLDGVEHQLALNCGPNAHHGGLVGLDKVLWKHSVNHEKGEVTFSYLSKDGEEGYPGDVIFNVVYGLAPSGGHNEVKQCVKVEMRAMVTAPTPINLTSHGYFNLAGHHSGVEGINEHLITMSAQQFTPINENQIPTGEIKPVAGTVFDLTSPTRFGDVLSKCPGGDYNGFDHNLIVSTENKSSLAHVSSVIHKPSGRFLHCFSDQPGCHLYTANFFPTDDSFKGKGGAIYKKHGAFCLETQKYPDSVNHSNFPSSIVRPGEVYSHTVLYQFGENEV